MENFDTTQIVQLSAQAELSIIPLRLDGTKAPDIPSWKQFQEIRPGEELLSTWFSQRKGVGIVTGKVSGQLEVIDIDDATLFDEFKLRLGNPGLWEKLVIVKTPKPGYHLLYRCADGIGGNQKLASTIRDGKQRCLIETRGEGGYICGAGSPPELHPTRKTYTLLSGSYENISCISAAEREALLATARSFNQIESTQVVTGQSSNDQGHRPGDRYNRHAIWSDVLQPHNWILQWTDSSGASYWQKPDSSNGGIHATTNHANTDYLYVFSTSAEPFEPEHAYSKFAAYALLNHHGKFPEAAAALREQGYGSPSLDDIGNAERLVERHGDDLLWLPQMSKWFIWNGGCWSEDVKGAVTTRAQETASSVYNEAAAEPDSDTRRRIGKWAQTSCNLPRVRAMIDSAKPKLARMVDELDRNGMLLTCKNGTIDLETGRLLPHRKDNLTTKQIALNFDPAAKAPVFEKFIDQIFQGNRELIKYVQKCLGYSLTDNQSEQVFFIAHGDGCNGKSTFFNCIQDVLGPYAQSAAPDLIISKKERFATNDMARLKGARFVTSMETGEFSFLDEERVKKLTGGDTITARFLHQEFFEFKPTHKLWLITNHMPEVRGSDHAIWRRLKKIPFNYTIPEDARDGSLPDKLRDEQMGILAWLVEGCRLYQLERLTEPTDVIEATSSYKNEQDIFGQFFRECIIVDETAFTFSKDLLNNFHSYSNDSSMNTRIFGKRLSSKGLKSIKRSSGNGFAVRLRTDQENKS